MCCVLAQLVKLMKGNIGLEERDFKTLFWFEVPLPASTQASTEPGDNRDSTTLPGSEVRPLFYGTNLFELISSVCALDSDVIAPKPYCSCNAGDAVSCQWSSSCSHRGAGRNKDPASAGIRPIQCALFMAKLCISRRKLQLR